MQNDEEQVRFLFEDEIVRDYINSLSTGARQEWMSTSRDDLDSLHWGAGQWIRNHYRLWHPDNPYMRGYPDNPDRMSAQIIERVWHELHGKAYQPEQD